MIGLLAHSEKPGAAAVVQAMAAELARQGIPFLLERATAPLAGAVSDLDEQALAAQCEPKPRESISNRGSSTLRASLDRAITRDSTAEIRVRLTESYNNDSPFGGGDSSFTQTFVLTMVEGQWRFAEAPWPTYCPQPAPLR